MKSLLSAMRYKISWILVLASKTAGAQKGLNGTVQPAETLGKLNSAVVVTDFKTLIKS
jgi:hypothetical protein